MYRISWKQAVAVIREDILKEMVSEQTGGVKGGLKSLTLAWKSQLSTFLPDSAFSDQTGNFEISNGMSILTLEISKP